MIDFITVPLDELQNHTWVDVSEVRARGYKDETVRIIAKYFASIDDDEYPYSDNYRFARAWKGRERRRYRKQRDEGCCGCVDELVDTPDGKMKVGFNYGH